MANNLIEITGSTDDDATVRVNQDLIMVDSNGNFKKQLTLPSTETKIDVEAKSPSGKTTVVEKIYK
jgi:hypothetical protein